MSAQLWLGLTIRTTLAWAAAQYSHCPHLLSDYQCTTFVRWRRPHPTRAAPLLWRGYIHGSCWGDEGGRAGIKGEEWAVEGQTQWKRHAGRPAGRRGRGGGRGAARVENGTLDRSIGPVRALDALDGNVRSLTHTPLHSHPSPVARCLRSKSAHAVVESLFPAQCMPAPRAAGSRRALLPGTNHDVE